MPTKTEEKKASIEQLRAELDSGRLHKKGRMEAWQKNDAAYNGVVPVYAKLPYNFHLPILSGFEDTLVAKVDEESIVRFGSGQPGETRLARRIDALWKQQSDRPDHDYALAALVGRRHAARYGRAFRKVVGTKKPFSIDVIAVSPYDMVVDPLGGGELEDHSFCAQDGIFKNERQLRDGVASGSYDKAAVDELIAGPQGDKRAYNTESGTDPLAASLKQSGYGFTTGGSKVWRLVEHVTTVDGTRRLVVWCPDAGLKLSDRTLKEAYGCDLLPWTSWAPFYDDKVFWSKAPDDDIRQAAEAMRVTVMEMMTNVQKKNWGTRIYDPNVVSGADLVSSAPNGLVMAKAGAASMPGGLDGGFKIIQTPDVTVAVNVTEFLDRFVGQKTGVTPDAQGSSAEDKVGIYFGNIEQVADRMGLQSRWYRNDDRRVAVRFVWQAKRNLTGKAAVQVTGAMGAETEYLLAKDIDPSIGITVTGGRAEASVSEARRKERSASLQQALNNPLFAKEISPRVALEETLRESGFDDDEVKYLTTRDAGGGFRDQQLRAQEAVEKLLEGEKWPLYRGATTAFIQSVLESAKLYTDGDGPEHDRLVAYAGAHVTIAAQNAAFDAKAKATAMMLEDIGAGLPVSGSQPQQDMTNQAPQQGMNENPNVTEQAGTQVGDGLVQAQG